MLSWRHALAKQNGPQRAASHAPVYLNAASEIANLFYFALPRWTLAF